MERLELPTPGFGDRSYELATIGGNRSYKEIQTLWSFWRISRLRIVGPNRPPFGSKVGSKKRGTAAPRPCRLIDRFQSAGSAVTIVRRGKLVVMSDEFDADFDDAADATAVIRAAVRYLLKGAAGCDRGDIVREIIEVVSEVARGPAPGSEDPFEDELPGG